MRTNEPCKIEGCTRPRRCQGLCVPHYKRSKNGTDTSTPIRIFKRTLEHRIAQFSEKKESGCVEWTGALIHGYATITYRGKAERLSRLIWTMLRYPITSDELILHSCDNPKCINIEHLSVGTQLENVQDAHAKLRHYFGERHYLSKLTSEQVFEIRRKGALGVDRKSLGLEYGVSASLIGRIINNQNRVLG